VRFKYRFLSAGFLLRIRVLPQKMDGPLNECPNGFVVLSVHVFQSGLPEKLADQD
jgi:hypothetical protein